MAPKDIKFDIMGGYSKEEYNELDPQQTVNMFMVNAAGGKKAGFPSPGLNLEINFIQSPNRKGRNTYVFKNKIFVNVGEDVYRCSASSKGLDHAKVGSINTQTGYVGTSNLENQLRFVDGQVRPFEINPRFSGTTSARAFNGYNEPEFFIRKYLLGDNNALESILTNRNGYIVKGLDERYFSFER